MLNLTHHQRAEARAALGLPAPGNTTTRNRMAVAPDAPGKLNTWHGLVACGAAELPDAEGAQAEVFRLTQAGALAVLQPGESLCPQEFPDAPAAAA
ncbi:hypothetical protein EOD42_02895 [Rhodovarius crocodyli]|uniref:Uncharacterized protein n=1 Tax=Rhodovarius crocodyli TaxID=1979269 RepID=A0A437MN78_9PROT|nr:hypothetical protein [Rhodovarius crocodyli]RVT99070.1 hypothetical protein EOD42_02895 [Rhodovarius crocodyli]